ncbi:ATP-grasp domain-containing protein [Paenibacillus vandeheii]
MTSINQKVPMIKAINNALRRACPEAILYGADSNADCIGKYWTDAFWVCPSLDQMSVKELIMYCKEKNISMIIPSRDGELLYFARNQHILNESGIKVMISGEKAVNFCLDKLNFSEVLNNQGYPVIPTFVSLDELHIHLNTHSLSYVVKERFGAGAVGIGIDVEKVDALNISRKMNSPVFQPFISGTEYSIDMFLSRKSLAQGTVARKRNRIVNGESQITTTTLFPELEELCKEIASKNKLQGHVMFQAIVDGDNRIHIIECNCRFGGASTLSVAMGLDSFFWFYKESIGLSLEHFPFQRVEKERMLIRHAEDLIL